LALPPVTSRHLYDRSGYFTKGLIKMPKTKADDDGVEEAVWREKFDFVVFVVTADLYRCSTDLAGNPQRLD
jgi:hypothetical protein